MVKRSNHDRAINYSNKAKLLGLDIIEYKLLDGDKVLLTGVMESGHSKDKRLVIPGFITDFYDVNKSRYKGVLDGKDYEEIYIDNDIGVDIDISYLCSGMVSNEIKIDVKYNEYVVGIVGLFHSCKNAKRIDVSGLNLGAGVRNLYGVFRGCGSLKEIDISNWDLSNIEYMEGTFGGCSSLEYIKFNKNSKTSKLKSIQSLFDWCDRLNNIDLSWMDVGNVTNMSSVFYGCSGLESVIINDWDVRNVTDMSSMFNMCSRLTDISGRLIGTSKVEDMSSMFSGCKSIINLDLVYNFDMSNVKGLYGMFLGCENIRSLDLSNWNISGVYSISGLFYGCKMLVDLRLGRIQGVSDLSRMFYKCESLKELDLSGCSIFRDVWIQEMFYGCKALEYIDMSNIYVNKIERNHRVKLFFGCKSLKDVKFPAGVKIVKRIK